MLPREDDFKDTKPAETEFRVSEPLVEFNNAALNRELLERMVAITGGQYYDYGKTAALKGRYAQGRQGSHAGRVRRCAEAAVGHADRFRRDSDSAGRRMGRPPAQRPLPNEESNKASCLRAHANSGNSRWTGAPTKSPAPSNTSTSSAAARR